MVSDVGSTDTGGTVLWQDIDLVAGGGDMGVEPTVGVGDFETPEKKRFKPNKTSTGNRLRKKPLFSLSNLEKTRKKGRKTWGESSWDMAIAKSPALREYVDERQQLDKKIDEQELTVVNISRKFNQTI